MEAWATNDDYGHRGDSDGGQRWRLLGMGLEAVIDGDGDGGDGQRLS